MREPVEVVLEWHEALNREDGDAVLALSHEEIEIVGPRGSGSGLDLLRGWLLHARVRLHPGRAFARGDTVVMEQRGVWRSPETGETVGEAAVASVLRVREGRIAYFARFDALEPALEHAGLRESDACR